MASDTLISVQVCYIAPELQFLKSVQVLHGGTVQQAIESSGLLELLGSVSLSELKVGIYSRLKTLDTVLKDRDRVEVYRPLQIDPMMARRKRAVRKKSD